MIVNNIQLNKFFAKAHQAEASRRTHVKKVLMTNYSQGSSSFASRGKFAVIIRKAHQAEASRVAQRSGKYKTIIWSNSR